MRAGSICRAAHRALRLTCLLYTSVYLLARTASGSDNILVVILGNAFVMVLEGLIVGIQVMRLEFFELFSRFYSGSGTPYQPFEIHYSKNTTGGKQ